MEAGEQYPARTHPPHHHDLGPELRGPDRHLQPRRRLPDPPRVTPSPPPIPDTIASNDKSPRDHLPRAPIFYPFCLSWAALASSFLSDARRFLLTYLSNSFHLPNPLSIPRFSPKDF